MSTKIREIMTTDPLVLEGTESVRGAAQQMLDGDVGAVLVEEYGELRGIVTDRDLVTRVIAGGVDPEAMVISQVASTDLHSVGPDDTLSDAVSLMREHAIRRVAVVEEGVAVGILSLGDLAIARDPESVLGDISADSPNT